MYTRCSFSDAIGQTIGTSRWFDVGQDRIDAFAQASEDHQFIHVDPDRARQGPFGRTIAHGFLTLSLLSAMLYDCGPEIEGEVMAVNYGFNRLRFLSPVPAGARLRAVFVLKAADAKGPDAIEITFDVTVEIEGQDKPALSAEWINRRYFEGQTA